MIKFIFLNLYPYQYQVFKIKVSLKKKLNSLNLFTVTLLRMKPYDQRITSTDVKQKTSF